MKTTFKILSVLFVLLAGFAGGGMIAVAAGFNPVYFVAGTTTLGLLAGPMKGVLPMSVNIVSQYTGEVLDQLLVRATTGNELVSGGHIHIQPNVQYKFAIPRLRAGNMLQKRKEQPTEEDAKGDFTIDEKYLEPEEFMAFTTFNPRSFESFWRPFQPTGNLVFRELPAEVQNKLLGELAKVVDFQLGNEFINGEFGESEGQFFNGILTRITGSNEVIKVNADALKLVTSANILSLMKDCVSALPKAMKKQNVKKFVKFFMSVSDFETYDHVLTEKPQKGVDYTRISPELYKGYRIVPLADWPDNVFVLAYATSGIDSNLWAGVDYVNDSEVVQIDKLTNAGERYFFKMLMKADTQVVFPEDVVLYDAREAVS